MEGKNRKTLVLARRKAVGNNRKKRTREREVMSGNKLSSLRDLVKGRAKENKKEETVPKMGRKDKDEGGE